MTDYEERHPSTKHMMDMLRPNVNLKGTLKIIAEDVFYLADNLIDPHGHALEDSPEITAGLRKLLEAKDCFVRAAVFQNNPDANKPVDYRDR